MKTCTGNGTGNRKNGIYGGTSAEVNDAETATESPRAHTCFTRVQSCGLRPRDSRGTGAAGRRAGGSFFALRYRAPKGPVSSNAGLNIREKQAARRAINKSLLSPKPSETVEMFRNKVRRYVRLAQSFFSSLPSRSPVGYTAGCTRQFILRSIRAGNSIGRKLSHY